MQASSAAEQPQRGGTTRIVGAFVLLAAVVAIVWHFTDMRRFAELAAQARPAWLLVGVALQVATYVCAGAIWWLVLGRSRAPQPLRTLALLSVGKLFTDQAFPSGGVSGDLFLLRALVRRCTSTPLATAALVVNLLGFYAALLLAAGASLLFLWIHHEANAVLVAMTMVLVLVATAVISALLVLVRGTHPRFRARLVRFRALEAFLDTFAEAPRESMRDRVSLAGSFVLQLATIVLDAATLGASLAALGVQVHPGAVFASFVFAMIAEVTGLVPGGLGTFEGTSVALLHLSGVGLEPALAATLLLRGLTFWLPMLPGVAIVHREI